MFENIYSPSMAKALTRIYKLIDEYAQPSIDSVDSLIAFYLDHCRNVIQMTPISLRQQYFYLRYFLNWLRQNTSCSVANVDTKTIENFLKFQSNVKHNSQTQINHYLYTIKAFFGLLYSESLIRYNPSSTFKAKTIKVCNLKHILTYPEIQKMLQIAQNLIIQSKEKKPQKIHQFVAKRNAAILGILIQTGIRLGELLSISIDDLDLADNTILISGKGSRKLYFKERIVFLYDTQIIDMVHNYLTLRKPYPARLLFISTKNKPLEPNIVRSFLKRYARLASINKNVTPHSLRATFASLLVKNGIDPLSLKSLMGHRDFATTLNLYAKLDQDTVKEMWRKFNPLTNLKLNNGD